MSVRMTLFGAFTLKHEGVPVAITSPRNQSLLAYLALHREPVSRQRLAFLLWPDSSESQSFTNLRTLLHRIQAVLPDDLPLLKVDSQIIVWNVDVALDVIEFEAEIDRANAATQRDDLTVARAALEQAIELYTDDLLPDCYDEWALAKREYLREKFLTAQEQLVSLLEQNRQYILAISHARRLLHLDPLNEAVYLTLMRLHTVSGNRASALRVYHECASTLQAELGVQPGTLLSDAYEHLLAIETTVPTDTPPRTEPALIGRDKEWKRMQAIWEVAVAGRPRLLILEGEAGVGKTRLGEELLRWANRQGFVTAITHCYPAEGDLAYASVTTLIRSESLRPSLERLTAQWLQEIARLAPNLANMRSDIQPTGPVTQSWQRQRLFEALAHLVLAPKRPILLLFDDIQWCDRDTLEWLHFLMRFEPDARLLLVATLRTEEINKAHPITELTEVLRREGRLAELVLDRLNREETAALADQMLGYSLNHDEADRLYTETEGNPLFIVEILRTETTASVVGEAIGKSQPRSAQSVPARPDLPPRVLAVIARRLRRLSPEAHSLVEVAAVIGRSFTFDVLFHAADLTDNDLVRSLDELWQRHILREHGSDSYDFTHGKLRSVAYYELSSVRRRALHQQVAEAMTSVYSGQLDTVSGQIAQHYHHAAIVEQAVEFYRRAAAYASDLYVHNAAIAYLQNVLELTPLSDTVQLLTIYDQLGDALHFVGRYAEARTAWQNALGLTHDRVALANLYCKLGNAWRDEYLYEDAMRSYDLAEEKLNKADDDSEDIWFAWGQIKLEWLNVLYWLGQSDMMVEALDEIRPILHEHGSPLQIARLHQVSAIALLRANRYTESPLAIQYMRSYLKTIMDMDNHDILPAAHFQMGFVMLWASDDLLLVEEHLQEALAFAAKRGDVSLECRCLTYLAVVTRLRGQIEYAQTYSERSLDAAKSGQMYEYIGAAHGNLAWVAWQQDSLIRTKEHGEAALAAWEQYSATYMFEWIARWPLIGALFKEGNLADAILHIRALLDSAQKRMPSDIETVLETAISMAEAGNNETAQSQLRIAIEIADKYRYL